MSTYRSKVDRWLPVSIFSILLIIVVIFLFLQAWLTAGIVLLLILFIAHLFLNTYYTLTVDTLHITCGLLYKKHIPLQTIRKIMPVKSVLSSPALSMDKLLIFFDRQQVMISPENKEAFLQEIKKLNPSINI